MCPKAGTCSDSQYNHLKLFRMKPLKATNFTVSDSFKDWQEVKHSCHLKTINMHALRMHKA